MIINHNLPAQNALRKSQKNEANAANSLEKLSSGLRINRAADDPSGLCISERMRSQIREMDTCEMNVDLGISVCDVADGALGSITDMLQRCRELSVQAASTTYTTEDCQEIEKEMAQLFDEISHITKDTQFNTIPLFSGQLKKFYEESIKTLPPGELTDWKDLGFIPGSKFDLSEPAKPATIELPLNGLNSGIDLIGKSFVYTDPQYNYKTLFQFYDSTPPATLPPEPSGYSRVQNIAIDPTATKEQITNQLKSLNFYNPGVANPTVEVKDDKLIIKQPIRSEVNEFHDPDYKAEVPLADGEFGNQASISGTDNPGLGKIEASYDYGMADEQKKSVLPLTSGNFNWSNDASFNGTMPDSLKKNTLHLGDKDGDKAIIHFRSGGGNSISGKDIYIDIDAENSRSKIFTALQGLNIPGIEFKEDAGSNKFIEFTSNSKWPDTPTNVYIREDVAQLTPGTPAVTNTIYPSFGPAPVSVSATAPTSPEGHTSFEVSVGNINKGSSIALTVGGSTYNLYFYDSADTSGKTPYLNNSYGYLIDINGKSQEDLTKAISNYISGNGNLTVDAVNTDFAAGKLAFTHKFNGDQTSYIRTGNAPTNSLYVVTTPGTSPTYSPPILASTSNTYFTLKTPPEVQLDLKDFIAEDGTLKNKENLKNLGFKWKDQYGTDSIFELYSGEKQRSDSIGIDISGCTTAEALAEAISRAVDPRCQYTVAGTPEKGADNKYTGTIDLALKGISTTHSKSSVERYTGGVLGFVSLFGEDEQKFSGGTHIKAPQATLDFSGASDMDSLRGSGFQVTCASCKGEYINIIFRGNNSPPAPESFEIEVDGVTRTIQNIIIEIENAKSPSDLAKAIVEQGNAKMHHFTEFAIDPENPAKVIARDKRWGDLTDAGIPLRAEVKPTVHTNFELNVNISYEKVSFPMKIYVGSSPHQSIDIELPALSLEELALDKPRPIKLRPVEEATAWLGRIEDATAFISGKRSTIGATKNRLEYAKEQLQTASINTSDSESRIRDLDMAKEMVKYMKDSILAQTSQAMQAQANSRPQSVLELLR